ncbi:cation:proton antiporter regulatory subunit [Bacillus atrophaeus]|uniref:cation:proton antiporter regulatory subunit n=1 Tax=Bacillus atrophaeus TaxID=1452 RepID=UPI002280771C|nr:cation:proton antiporter regulatory subunit [Bacillus atrophaeus]MCY8825070.1 cation:proton antiporter regulatory subunit [Bacillus atrophaeus]MCY8841878.1 cation:proton antiporter regulatory subunit [Bacillus atrophaeus]MCY8976882.1 cation:proton antiporter regulatory subunit [Bacillus atrophaeus]MEC0804032.1 cation:proton antiporter regulatory subunit [Bacillus atrophaeus]MEC0852004.1 cation:proton antiporter regulatory subunit [Bacillus atrophaeus]
MKVRESELPGIGQKVEILTRNQDKICIIIHDDGRRELYYFDENDHEECVTSVQFNDAEARQLSAILGGMAYKPKALESVEVALDDLIIEWFKVEAKAPAVQLTLGDLDVRQHYQVTVIAIVKKNQQKQLNPGADTVIEEGDTLVISGERKGLKKLIQEKLTASET